MDVNIQSSIETLRTKYEPEGFLILGVFGSVARGEADENSDIDILYDIDQKFVEQYGGFGGFARLGEIKEELAEYFGRPVDIVSKSGLDKVGEKYILNEVIYV